MCSPSSQIMGWVRPITIKLLNGRKAFYLKRNSVIEFYCWVNSVDNVVCKTCMSSNFTVGLIPSITSCVKLTCHRTVWFFFNSFFSHCDSLGIYRRNIPIGVYRRI
jgi:hypothetical protein